MILEKVKPITASRRQLIKLNQKSLNVSKKPLLKDKIIGKKNSSGRNNSGKITVFHKGGGVKKRYRKVDFNRKFNSIGIICTIEHDPNRNAFIASVFNFINKKFSYIIAPQGLRVGDIVKSGLETEPSLGSSLPIGNIPIGTPIYNVSPKLFSPAQISRSAGTFSIIKEKTETYAVIELSSGELRYISSKCFASIGEVSKELYFLTRLGKAGQSRWLNKRPTTRGVATNPVDHPHGGGEGKKSGRSRTPWGKPNQKGKPSKIINKLIIKQI
ncbi:50S ribosomal protein L2 (mitochondrion) [Nitzschia inconspicua]|uniref:50S ribosomal protein L2 n=1 Tax=Nitzschia inconspicua TaxID=303405 RepID=A0A8H2SII9_9STRA|nr:50S ribosomal protein L2 [Nitzschia inconspicua]